MLPPKKKNPGPSPSFAELFELTGWAGTHVADMCFCSHVQVHSWRKDNNAPQPVYDFMKRAADAISSIPPPEWVPSRFGGRGRKRGNAS